jgi:Holliday junction resolvasome RuvABC endonuclease subunit
MLTMPRGSSQVVSIMGLDPGTETLGVGILVVDLETWQIVSSNAQTFKGTKLVGKVDWISELHGDRMGRINAHQDNLVALMRHYAPFAIASESPFFNRLHPQAYGALMEVIAAIRHAVMLYDMWKPLHLVDPPTVKNAVGVKGNKGGPEGKVLMREAVLKLAPVLKYSGLQPLDQLDEHSIDALAVAYCRYLQLTEELWLARNS